MMIPALTNPNVFACHCQPAAEGLQVGILTVSDEFEPGWHKLYNLDCESEWHQVYIPLLSNPAYNVTLNYGNSIQDPG